MSEKQEPIFVDGMIFKAPNEQTKERAPWVKGHISIKRRELMTFIEQNGQGDEWLNIDLKKSKTKGTLYLQLNTYKPSKEQMDEVKEVLTDGESIPF